MKLTSHQKKIIDAIISKKVYDIPSYLDYFGKSHQCQYDFEKIREVFEQSENGRTYLFRKGDDAYYYTDTYDCHGNICNACRVPNTSTYEFVDYPITDPVKAHLNTRVNVEVCEVEGTKFSFDFMKESYPVADSFDDIIDFITLWSYLKREALILEVDKPISKNDISIFFELKDQEIAPNTNPYWNRHYTITSGESEDEPVESECYLQPEKEARHYITQVWKLNKENLLTCSSFIDKKIIASSELRVYQQKKFKTVEQIANRKNLFVAWIAVFISLISVFVGNIMPLFKPQETDYLSVISTQVEAIEESVKNKTNDEELLQEIKSITTYLSEISQQQLSKEDLAALENLQKQPKELNAYLSEITPE